MDFDFFLYTARHWKPFSKVGSKSYNCRNGGKNAWATTTVQGTLGTIQDG